MEASIEASAVAVTEVAGVIGEVVATEVEVVAEAGLVAGRTRKRSGCHAQSWDVWCLRYRA